MKTIFEPTFIETLILWCQQNPEAIGTGVTIGLMLLCYKLKDLI